MLGTASRTTADRLGRSSSECAAENMQEQFRHCQAEIRYERLSLCLCVDQATRLRSSAGDGNEGARCVMGSSPSSGAMAGTRGRAVDDPCRRISPPHPSRCPCMHCHNVVPPAAPTPQHTRAPGRRTFLGGRVAANSRSASGRSDAVATLHGATSDTHRGLLARPDADLTDSHKSTS